MTGLRYATVSDSESHLSEESSEERARKIFDLFELTNSHAEGDAQSGEVSRSEVFAKALTGGWLRDRFPEEPSSSLEQWRTQANSQSFTTKLLDSGREDKVMRSYHERVDVRLLVGRCFFRTHEGHIGLGPAGTKQGLLKISHLVEAFDHLEGVVPIRYGVC